MSAAAQQNKFPDFVRVLENEIIGGHLVTDHKAGIEQSSTAMSPTKSETRKPKILFVGTDINQPTGYARVTHALLTQLAAADASVIHFAIQTQQAEAKAGRTLPSSVKRIDADELEAPRVKLGAPQTGFAFRELPAQILKEKPDVVLIYNDLAVITAYLEEIRRQAIKRTFRIWAYVDQIYTYQPPAYVDVINRDCDRVFVFSTAWRTCLREQGLSRPCDVISHGFDQATFHQIPKEIARQSAGIPKDSFVFLSLNRNQPRKRLDILIMAFVELIVKYPTRPIFLMCICDKGDYGGYPLFDIYARELKLRGAPVDHFSSRLMITSEYKCHADSDINIFHNLADVGVSTADGEGFGLCTFEGLGLGVPQIVPDLIGYREYCSEENCLLVKPASRYYLPGVYSPVGGEARAVEPTAVAAAMEKYYAEADLRAIHAQRGVATVKKYTWERAATTLIKRLHEVCEEETED